MLLKNLHKGDWFEFPQSVNAGTIFQVIMLEGDIIQAKVIQGRFGYAKIQHFGGDIEVNRIDRKSLQMPLSFVHV
jgi:hypothetical protein